MFYFWTFIRIAMCHSVCHSPFYHLNFEFIFPAYFISRATCNICRTHPLLCYVLVFPTKLNLYPSMMRRDAPHGYGFVWTLDSTTSYRHGYNPSTLDAIAAAALSLFYVQPCFHQFISCCFYFITRRVLVTPSNPKAPQGTYQVVVGKGGQQPGMKIATSRVEWEPWDERWAVIIICLRCARVDAAWHDSASGISVYHCLTFAT